MSKEPDRIDSALEVSFDQTEIAIFLTSKNGSPLTWDHVLQVVKELRTDFEDLPMDQEVH